MRSAFFGGAGVLTPTPGTARAMPESSRGIVAERTVKQPQIESAKTTNSMIQSRSRQPPRTGEALTETGVEITAILGR